jgi:type III secretory pathway lipoprotein EscJ
LLLLVAACAPEIAGPVEQQRAADREDAVRLEAQLRELPGAVRAEVALHRPVNDVIGGKTVAASGAVVVVADTAADRAVLEASARKLVRATAPEIEEREMKVGVVVGAEHAELAKVGPFKVAEGSKRALQAALAAAFVVIATLAGWIAWARRPKAT